jgi:hypothetical protein
MLISESLPIADPSRAGFIIADAFSSGLLAAAHTASAAARAPAPA